MWQDIVIAISVIAFSYALIPQVISGFKKESFVNLQTSGITMIGMYVLSVVFYTLNLYFSMVMDFIVASLWLILFIQKIKSNKK